MPLPFEPEWACHCFDQQSPMEVMLLTYDSRPQKVISLCLIHWNTRCWNPEPPGKKSEYPKAIMLEMFCVGINIDSWG